MQRYAFSTGNGNDGVSHMYPDGHVEAETLDEAVELALDAIGATPWAREKDNYVEEWMDEGSISLVWLNLPDDDEETERDYAPMILDVFLDIEESEPYDNSRGED